MSLIEHRQHPHVLVKYAPDTDKSVGIEPFVNIEAISATVMIQQCILHETHLTGYCMLRIKSGVFEKEIFQDKD